jgi:hypothetical protein
MGGGGWDIRVGRRRPLCGGAGDGRDVFVWHWQCEQQCCGRGAFCSRVGEGRRTGSTLMLAENAVLSYYFLWTRIRILGYMIYLLMVSNSSFKK